MAQELVEQLKYKKLFDIDVWPVWDEELIREENFELIIQINGKTRGKVLAKTGVDELSAKNLALADSNIKKWLEGKEIKKVIFIQNRLMNLIV
jgi:leucyl-tRNA synthetase